VIDLTDYPKFIYDNHTLKEIQSCRNVWFSGIRSRYITIPSGRDSEMFVINFHRGRAYPFVEMPMNELTDYVVDGELVMSPEILNLRERLLMIPSINQKFRYTEHYLRRSFEKKLTINPFVEYAVNHLVQSPIQMTLGQLAVKVGFSQKHVIKIFKVHVGVTPKTFLRIMRFQKAIREIESSHIADWATIAHESGYYDQAHFINDFKDFSGFTPQQYLTTSSEFTNYVAVG
jgi:AraC-like DNA-binding protein